MAKVIEMYTDGACRGNPGPGGWGVVLRYGTHEKHFYGAESFTTNNRMELRAAIEGLALIKESCKVIITTDSQYLRNGITEWIKAWKKNNWHNSGKKPVKNVDLWQQLDQAVAHHEIEWHWVKAHAGHPENELADMLANKAIDEMNKK